MNAKKRVLVNIRRPFHAVRAYSRHQRKADAMKFKRNGDLDRLLKEALEI